MKVSDVMVILTISVLSILVVGCLFALIRNQWVFNGRMKILNRQPQGSGLDEFKTLISYDEMMRKWWIWDIEKLKKHD